MYVYISRYCHGEKNRFRHFDGFTRLHNRRIRKSLLECRLSVPSLVYERLNDLFIYGIYEIIRQRTALGEYEYLSSKYGGSSDGPQNQNGDYSKMYVMILI